MYARGDDSDNAGTAGFDIQQLCAILKLCHSSRSMHHSGVKQSGLLCRLEVHEIFKTPLIDVLILETREAARIITLTSNKVPGRLDGTLIKDAIVLCNGI